VEFVGDQFQEDAMTGFTALSSIVANERIKDMHRAAERSRTVANLQARDPRQSAERRRAWWRRSATPVVDV
jgi:hypothetical protein